MLLCAETGLHSLPEAVILRIVRHLATTLPVASWLPVSPSPYSGPHMSLITPSNDAEAWETWKATKELGRIVNLTDEESYEEGDMSDSEPWHSEAGGESSADDLDDEEQSDICEDDWDDSCDDD